MSKWVSIKMIASVLKNDIFVLILEKKWQKSECDGCMTGPVSKCNSVMYVSSETAIGRHIVLMLVISLNAHFSHMMSASCLKQLHLEHGTTDSVEEHDIATVDLHWSLNQVLLSSHFPFFLSFFPRRPSRHRGVCVGVCNAQRQWQSGSPCKAGWRHL